MLFDSFTLALDSANTLQETKCLLVNMIELLVHILSTLNGYLVMLCTILLPTYASQYDCCNKIILKNDTKYSIGNK